MSSIADHVEEARLFNPNAIVNMNDYYIVATGTPEPTEDEADKDDEDNVSEGNASEENEENKASEEQNDNMEITTDAEDTSEDSTRPAHMKPIDEGTSSYTVEAVLEGLRAKSDSKKAAALMILNHLLARRPRMASDADLMVRFWNAISPKFLDRLFSASSNPKLDPANREMSVDLAVGIVYTFSGLLPEEELEDERMLGRIKGLLRVLPSSQAETRRCILRTFQSIGRTPKAIRLLVEIESLIPLINVIPKDNRVVPILNEILINGSSYERLRGDIQLALETIVPKLIDMFGHKLGPEMLTILVEVFRQFPWELYTPTTSWFAPLVSFIKSRVLKQITPEERRAITIICSFFFTHFRRESEEWLFTTTTEDLTHSAAKDQQPFSWRFVTKIGIDLQVSIPGLLELPTVDYIDAAERLSAGLRIITAFIGFLVRDPDIEVSGSDIQLTPDLLLLLRRDLGSIMEMLIVFIREKWDRSVAAVTEKTADASPSEKSRAAYLKFTGRSDDSDLEYDPLPSDALGALALWLREDDNKDLRRKASSIIDVLLAIYDNHDEDDLRLPVLCAFEGIFTAPGAKEIFLKNEGWETLWCRDVSVFLSSPIKSPNQVMTNLEAVKRLVEVVKKSPAVYITNEEWLQVVSVAAKEFPAHLIQTMSLEELDMWTCTFLLAAQILIRARPEMRAGFEKHASQVATWVLKVKSEFLKDEVKDEKIGSWIMAMHSSEILKEIGFKGVEGGGS